MFSFQKQRNIIAVIFYLYLSFYNSQKKGNQSWICENASLLGITYNLKLFMFSFKRFCTMQIWEVKVQTPLR